MATHKYKVNPLFEKEVFLACLRKIGIDCYAVEDGICFDMEALLNVKYASMPHLVYMNLRFMKSTVHTVKL